MGPHLSWVGDNYCRSAKSCPPRPCFWIRYRSDRAETPRRRAAPRSDRPPERLEGLVAGAAEHLDGEQEGVQAEAVPDRRKRLRPGRVAGCSRAIAPAATAFGRLSSAHRALDHVLQLPDVLRPVETPAGSRMASSRDLRLTPLPICRGEALGEVLGEQRDVLPPLAQRRRAHGDHLQAVEEVLPEALRCVDELLEREPFVAEITRTSTSVSSVPPTRRIFRSCTARSGLTCIPSDVWPASS